MGGMGGGGLDTNDPTVVGAFHRDLLTGGFVVIALLLALLVVWRVCRNRQIDARRNSRGEERPPGAQAEPAGRRLLRTGFGLLWIFDGVLQGQASMPLGLVPMVIGPAAAPAPAPVRHLVDGATKVWAFHPAPTAAAAVWLQVGIGLFLVVSGGGGWSRLAGVASAGWGLMVWVLGEALGGLLSPGLSWLFGAPGAAFLYVVGGVLVAIPRRAWNSAQVGRWLLGALGLLFAGMAVLQAWPGRGSWQGGSDGATSSMADQMAVTPQPKVLASAVSWFAALDRAHGWAVNLFVVVALIATGVLMVGAALCRRHRAHRRLLPGLAVGTSVALCMADWVLVQDLGFMGGVGTDPNSMIPFVLLLLSAYTDLTRPTTVTTAARSDAAVPGWRTRMSAEPALLMRAAAAMATIGVTLVGAAPMAWAATHPQADTVLADVLAGPPELVDTPAPSFTLSNQFDQPFSLAQTRGKAVLVTFLDPVDTSDSPVIGRELREADSLLGAHSGQVALVAVAANTVLTDARFLRAFDVQEGLDRAANWTFVTGSPPALRSVWNSFGVDVETGSGGSVMSHSDAAFVIDPAGRIRMILDTQPGPASDATVSSYAELFAADLRKALRE